MYFCYQMAVDIKKLLLAKLPPIQWNNKTIFEDGSNADIQRTLIATTAQAVKMAKPIAPYFKGANDLESLQKIHSFIRSNLGYRRDVKGAQQIKLPNRFINESGDCKSNALFIYSIAKNLGIPIDFRFANYKSWQGKIPSHVYNIAFDRKSNKFVFVDGTSSKFGKEFKKPFYYKDAGLMKIQTLSDNLETIEGKRLNALKKGLKKAGRNVSKSTKQAGKFISKKATQAAKATGKGLKQAGGFVADKAKAGLLAVPRAAFLGLVSLNVRGYATALSSQIKANRESKIKSLWKQMGGEWPALRRAINDGSKKKRILENIAEPVTISTIAATIATASPVIAKLSSVLDKATAVQAAGKAIDNKLTSAKKLVSKASSFKSSALNNKNKLVASSGVSKYLAKNKNILKNYSSLSVASRAKLLQSIAAKTGQSVTAVTAAVNNALPASTLPQGPTYTPAFNNSSSGSSDSKPEKAEEDTTEQAPAGKMNSKKVVYIGLGLAALAAVAVVSSEKKKKRK